MQTNWDKDGSWCTATPSRCWKSLTKTGSPGEGFSELSPDALSEMLRRLREENFPWQRRQCPVARARPVPASSAPSSTGSPQARAEPQPSRAAAAKVSAPSPRAGRPRTRPLPAPPRCRASPGDRKRPSRSRFMAAANARAGKGLLGAARLRPAMLAQFRSAPLNGVRLSSLGSVRPHSVPLVCLLGSSRNRRICPLGSSRFRSAPLSCVRSGTFSSARSTPPCSVPGDYVPRGTRPRSSANLSAPRREGGARQSGERALSGLRVTVPATAARNGQTLLAVATSRRERGLGPLCPYCGKAG